jgi:hypothetical protein
MAMHYIPYHGASKISKMIILITLIISIILQKQRLLMYPHNKKIEKSTACGLHKEPDLDQIV